MRLAFIGVPSSAGAHWPGQEQAPAALRSSGLLEYLRSEGLEVVDLGDLPEVVCHLDPDQRGAQNLRGVVEVARGVADAVVSAREMGAVPLVVGGDCTITIGVVSGFRKTVDKLGLIYMDGGPDLNHPETTPTGILDSMGVTHLLGSGARELSEIGPVTPLLNEEDIVLFAFHPDNLNHPERLALEERTVWKFPVTEFTTDLSRVASAALTHLANRSEILVHFDVDVIEFVDFPVANFPQYNHGLTLPEASEALRMFRRSPSFAGLVVTEFNPDRDRDGSLTDRLARTIAAVLRPD